MAHEDPIPVLDLTPEITDHWDEFVATFEEVLRSKQFIMGPNVKAFEDEIAEYLGVEHAIGVNSGTDALLLALRALDIGPGDEVITSPFTFFATAEAISHTGATPVFVDIDPDTFNLDPELVAGAITERTKAILPVHLYGRPCDMEAIADIASGNGLKVVEDTAQALGATTPMGKAGTLGDAGAFSFFPSKNLGAFGDAGLVATNDPEIADRVRMLRTHGARTKYQNETLGYNSRLDEIQAALLRVKLKHLDEANAGRRRVAERYTRLLGELDDVIAPEVVDGHVFHQYTVRLPAVHRDDVQERLRAQGIGTMVYYPIPVHRLPVYEHLPVDCPRAEQAARQVLSLPMWPSMAGETAESVADALVSAKENSCVD